MNLTLATKILEVSIVENMCFCTTLADTLTPNEPDSDLGNRLTNVMLSEVSNNTLIFICILKLLEKSKSKKRKKP